MDDVERLCVPILLNNVLEVLDVRCQTFNHLVHSLNCFFEAVLDVSHFTEQTLIVFKMVILVFEKQKRQLVCQMKYMFI